MTLTLGIVVTSGQAGTFKNDFPYPFLLYIFFIYLFFSVSDKRADREASETLVLNAQNLMRSVKEVVQAAQSATLKLKPGSAAELMWKRRD